MAKAKEKAVIPPPLERGTRKVRDLKPYAQNARTHTAEQVERIAASMLKFGWTNAVLIRGEDDTILAGHGRVLAGDLLGIVDAPVVIARGWSPDMVRAYVIADNKLAEDAGWDEDILKAEVEALAAADFDLSLTGFAPGELEAILHGEDDDDEEEDENDEPDQVCAKCGRTIVPDKDLTRRAKRKRKQLAQRRQTTSEGDSDHDGDDA